jgi:hypothetical protein
MPASELDRHVWLQVPLGTEVQDLDPTLPGIEPGLTIANAAAEASDVLPDELRHRIVITVTAERISGSTLSDRTIV